MNVSIRPIAKFLYGFFAAVFLIVGATVLLLWFDVGGRLQSVSRPMINTIPFVLFAVVGLLRKNSEER
jgi:hypothetical protein